MSRFRPQVGPSISLFPFLAVLLCTMGALLVLLVLFSSSADRADAKAAAIAAAEAAAEATRALEEELESARDDMLWRIDQLADVKARTMDDLARARMRLAGIEADSRALVDELDALERIAIAIEETPEEETDGLADLEQRLADTKARVDEAKREAAERPPAYAVVPYDGDSGTRRRPLYIECCIDGVFLQPEGIRLGPSDFEGPPGPGNPLASALRAAREYLASRPGESGDPNTQPYPLLLVRPSGVMAYYAARESLQSWGSEFGYQFVDEDWKLMFPPADSALADAETRAIEEARRRLEWLAQVRPPKRTKPAVQYRAATTRGGVVAAGGPSVLGDQSRWDWTEEQAGAAGSPGRGFRAGGDGQGQGDAVVGNGNGHGDAGGDANGGDRRWSAAGWAGGSETQFVGPSKFYGGSGEQPGAAGGDGGGAGGGADGFAQAGGSQGAHGASGPQDAASPQGTAGMQGGGSDGSGGADSQGSANGASAGTVGALAAGGAPGSAGSGSASASMQQASGGAGGGGSGTPMPGMPQSASASMGGPAANAVGGADAAGSLAGRRGSNWASLASQDRPIPLTRPIRLECARDEFRLMGDGGRVVARVPIGPHTADSVDPLVRHVHTTVGSWGMAGDRMYWRPELVLIATPDGGARLNDLEDLLADSGLDTRRATADTRDRVRPLPPVYRTGALPSSY